MEDFEINIDDLLKDIGTLSPATFQYYKGLKNRTIIINDTISSDIVETVMLPLLEMDSDGTGRPITIYLSTLGGSLFDGMPLANVIDSLKTPTTIVVPTYSYSMGGLILMAGYNNPNVHKVCYKYSTALLHAGSSYLEGSTNAVKDVFDFHQKYEELIKEYTITHSKITEEEYTKMERYEFYMTSDTMLEKGLVDEIL